MGKQLIQTTEYEYHLLMMTRDSEISFHGGDASRSDLRMSLKYWGYTSYDWGTYEDYVEASATLVQKGLGVVSRGWFNLTDAGILLAEELFDSEV